MVKRLQGKCDLFIRNRQEMQKGFTWDYPAVKGLAAMLYTVCGKEVDINYIRTCRKFMRNALANTGYAEGQGLISAATLLALSENTEKDYQRTVKLYHMFVDRGFRASVYILMASLNVVKYKDESEFERLVDKAVQAYERVMENEWFASLDLESAYKEVFAVSFAEMDIDTYIEKTKQCYVILKDVLPTWDSVFVVTDTLLMNSSHPENKCKYVKKIYNQLREKGYYFKYDFEYSALGVLALVSDRVSRTVADVTAVCDYLETRREFKA